MSHELERQLRVTRLFFTSD